MTNPITLNEVAAAARNASMVAGDGIPSRYNDVQWKHAFKSIRALAWAKAGLGPSVWSPVEGAYIPRMLPAG